MLPGAALVTSVGAREPTVAPSEAGVARVAAAVAGREIDTRLAIVREVSDAAAAEVLSDLLTRHAGLETPAVPFELRPPVFAVNGDVEVGWPMRKVGAFLDHQGGEAAALAAAGWTMFAIDRGLVVDDLVRALGILEAR